MAIRDEEEYEDSYDFVLESYGTNRAAGDEENDHLDDILSDFMADKPSTNTDTKPVYYPKRNESSNFSSKPSPPKIEKYSHETIDFDSLQSDGHNYQIDRRQERPNRLDLSLKYPQDRNNSPYYSHDHLQEYSPNTSVFSSPFKIQGEEFAHKDLPSPDPDYKPTRINPFIIPEQDLTSPNLSTLELVPQEISKKKKLFEKKSKYHDIVEQKKREQLQAQQIFRDLNNEFSLPPPPNSPPKANLSKRLSMDLVSRSPKVGKQEDRASFIVTEHEAREERLKSLGIFELFPKSTKKSHLQTPLNSFKTPAHHRPIKYVEDIWDITNPVLVSTSSQMYTVPISEIIKDLKAAGRYREEDFVDYKEKKKGISLFR
jgi:hypothetical protein